MKFSLKSYSVPAYVAYQGTKEYLSSRYNYKGDGSRTQTYTKKKSKMVRETDGGSYGKLYKFSVLNKRVPYGVSKGKHQITEGRSGVSTCQAGAQEPDLIIVNHTKSQLTTVSASSTLTKFQGQATPVSLMVDLYNSGGGFVATNVTDSFRNNKMFCHSLNYTLEFTNAENVGTYCTLYCVTPKMSTGQDAPSDWLSTSVDTDYGFGLESFPTAGSGTTVATVGALTLYHPYSKMFAIDKMKSKWRLLGIKEFQLGPGACKQLKWNIKMNTIINYEFIEKTGDPYMANQTIQFVLVQVGATVISNVVPLASQGTYSACKTAWTSQCTATYSPMKIAKEYPFKVGYNRVPFATPIANLATQAEVITSAVTQS